MTDTTFGRNTGLVVLSILSILVFASCQDFFGTDDLKQAIKDEVDIANAPEVSLEVHVDPAIPGGTTSPGLTTQKVGIPFPVAATAFTEYAFIGWTEIGGNSAVEFADAPAASTTATITKSAAGIVIQANFTRRPEVESTDPGDNQLNVLKNKKIMINFDKPMDPATVTFGNISLTSKPYGSEDPATALTLGTDRGTHVVASRLSDDIPFRVPRTHVRGYCMASLRDWAQLAGKPRCLGNDVR